jgi:hypothetical protein
MPSTLSDLFHQNLTDELRILSIQIAHNQNASNRQFAFGNFYKLGTLNLAATGDQFTHDAATFPVLRTRLGQASQAVPLRPLVQITTACSVTAPIFILRTAAGAAGYVDEDGNSVIGTKTMTMPSVTTAVQSTYLFRLEDGDSAITDITAIEVTTASSTGAATIWGFEELGTVPAVIGSEGGYRDAVFSGLRMATMNSAVATSGTASSFSGILAIGSNAAATPHLVIKAVLDA